MERLGEKRFKRRRSPKDEVSIQNVKTVATEGEGESPDEAAQPSNQD
jgi:hypothetical protein